MATYTVRGSTSHNIIYWYETPSGETKQHWETYQTELEALQRKTSIDYMQKNKLRNELYKAAMEYKERREKERAVLETISAKTEVPAVQIPIAEDNTNKTYREFADKWLPFHARKNVSLRTRMTATVAIWIITYYLTSEAGS